MLAGAVTAQIGPRMAALPRFWKIPAVQEATPKRSFRVQKYLTETSRTLCACSVGDMAVGIACR